MNLRAGFFAVLTCLGCERSATPATQAAASSTTTSLVASATPVAPQQVVDALESAPLPEFQIAYPDSSEGDWYLEPESDSVSPEFFVGSHVRHPSGVMVIWLDTAVRATDEHPVGRVHADSVVVDGLRHLEYLGRYCFDAEGFPEPRVVGLLPGPDTTARPRLAWRFNVQAFRIERYPINSLRCMMKPAEEGDD